MQKTCLSRWSTRSGLLAVALLAACVENGVAPLDVTSIHKPNFLIQTITTNWDFTSLLNLGSGCHLLASPTNINQTGSGTIAVTATGALPTSKGQELPVGDTERGLGLDVDPAAGCQGDEVGDITPPTAPYNGILFLDLNGVLPVGSHLTEIALGSLQVTEGWKVSYSTTGIAGAYTLLSQGCSTGGNTPGDNLTISTSLATANLVLKFEKNTACPGEGITDNDYTVKSVTTAHDEGQEGCTLTQGYWKTHSAVGPAPFDDAWLNIGPLGEQTLFFNTGKTWIQIFNTSAAVGNGFIMLAQQYMAAKLSILNGASATGDVTAAITFAETYFSGKGAGVISESNKTLNNTLKTYAATLEAFNSGVTGPGHCDDLEVLPL